MKTLLTIVAAIAAGAGIYIYISNKGALTTQTGVVIESASISPGLLNTVINFVVTITNPSNATQDITSFTSDVVYNNTPIAKINYLNKLTIPANGKVTITVPVQFSNLELFAKIPDLVESSASGIKLLLSGAINTSFGSIPFNNVTTII